MPITPDAAGRGHGAVHAGAADAYDPKPAYDAALTYSHELEGFQFKERIKTASGDDYVLSFTNNATACLAAWTTAPTPHELNIPAPDGVYIVTSYDGKKQREVATSGGVVTLKVDGAPQYLKPK